MEQYLQDAMAWARQEFGGAQLGDKRRTQRLVKVAAQLADDPNGVLHARIPGYAELIAAYRLMDSEGVTFETVTAPHHQRVRAICLEPGSYLMIEDTTTLDFTSREQTRGLGRIGNDEGRGLYLHSTLACRICSWQRDGTPVLGMVGMLEQRLWARTRPTEGRIGKRLVSKGVRLGREREWQRWAQAFTQAGPLPEGVNWTFMGDREADIYEAVERASKTRGQWLIRACQDRALEETEQSLFEAVAAGKALGTGAVPVRARPGQAARVAQVELRATRVLLRAPWRPDKRLAPLATNVVEVREVGAAQKVEPLHWVLLTSWPVSNREQIWRVGRSYACRPLIEEYHRALKSGGTNVERSQMKTAQRLGPLVGVLSLAAVRLLRLRTGAKLTPHAPLPPDELGPEALSLLERAHGKPAKGWTYLSIILAIATLGGFLGRKGDGLPGWGMVWRGWHKLMIMVEAARLLGLPPVRGP